jgi:hypothetical protein
MSLASPRLKGLNFSDLKAGVPLKDVNPYGNAEAFTLLCMEDII